MRLWRRPPTPGPQTIVGQWLRALLLDQRELRDELAARLNGGQKGWNRDEPAVVEAVCEILVRRLFPPGVSPGPIASLAADVRRVAEGALPAQQAIEALVRAALDGPGPDTPAVPPPQAYRVHVLVIAFVRGRLPLHEAAIDQVILAGERIASERGRHPPGAG